MTPAPVIPRMVSVTAQESRCPEGEWSLWQLSGETQVAALSKPDSKEVIPGCLLGNPGPAVPHLKTTTISSGNGTEGSDLCVALTGDVSLSDTDLVEDESDDSLQERFPTRTVL